MKTIIILIAVGVLVAGCCTAPKPDPEPMKVQIVAPYPQMLVPKDIDPNIILKATDAAARSEAAAVRAEAAVTKVEEKSDFFMNHASTILQKMQDLKDGALAIFNKALKK